MSDSKQPDVPQPDPIAAARDEFRDAGVRPAAPDTAGEQPGDVIDRYKLLQQIGEGGMGTVWMAEQSEPVRRKVALKIIKLGMDTKEVVVRFEAERQALALMDHPSIAKVLDGGVTATGRPFFVMELVRGIPITEFCDQAKLGLAERLKLFEKTCEALQHAHHKGVVHRDVKPSNVMVTLHDGTPLPKVIDFGIAKATSAELTQKTLFTQYAHMIGTPEYMAPEQAELSALDVDTRADVYSLGVLLYELLTGTTPFDVRKVLEKGYAELMRTIREDEPAKPSTRVSTLGDAATSIAASRHVNVDRLSTRLRGDLDRIVMKAMSKDRSRRYDTATSFAADIGRFLRDEPVLAVAPSALYRARKFVHRRRKTVIAGGLLAASLIVGAVGTTLGWYEAQRANEELSDQIATTKEAEADSAARARELERVVRFLGARLGEVDLNRMGDRIRSDIRTQLPAERGVEVDAALNAVNFSNTAAKSLQHAVFAPTATAIDTSFGGAPLIRARLLAATSIGQFDLDLFEEALVNGRRSLELYAEHAGPEDHRTVDMALLVAKFMGANAKWDRAEELAREGLKKVESFPKHDDLHWHGRNILGVILARQGRYAEAEAEYRRALTLMDVGESSDDALRLTIRQSLVSVLAAQGKFEEAEPAARRVLMDTEAMSAPGSQKRAHAQGTLAQILCNLGKTREALPLERQCYAGMRKHLGDSHSQTMRALSSLGRSLMRNGDLDEAEQCFELLLQRSEAMQGERQAFARSAYNGLATIASARGDFEEAQRLTAKVEPFEENTVRSEMLRLGKELNAAILLLNAGKPGEALKDLRRLYKTILATGGREHSFAGITACHIGSALSYQGQWDEAEAMLRRAIEDCSQNLGPNHLQTRQATTVMAVHQQRRGNVKEADALFQQLFDYHRHASGPDSQATLNAQVNVATTRQQLGKFEEARTLLEQAVAGLTRQLGVQNPSTVRARGRLVTLLVEAEDYDEARSLGVALLKDVVKVYGAVHPETQNHTSTMAILAMKTGDNEGALQLWRDYLEAKRQLSPKGTAGIEGIIGGVLLKLGRYEEAEPLLRASLVAKEAAAKPDRLKIINRRVQIALVCAHRGKHGDAGDWVAQAMAELTSIKEPNAVGLRIVTKTSVLTNIVSFYESWHAASPNSEHSESLAQAREQLQAARDAGR